MKPDRTNYEIWLIDYLDGNLDGIREKQLIAFLEENPDIREECSDVLTYSISPESGSFKHKNNLKRGISDLSEAQFEYLCISAAENDITQQQRTELDAIISENPEKKKVFDTIKRLKLSPPVVVFKRKPALKRLTTVQKVVRISVLSLSAAAGIAIMISIFNLPANEETVTPSLASTIIIRDSVSKESREKIIIAYNTAPVNKEIPESSAKDNVALPEITTPEVVESNPYQQPGGDTLPVVREIRTDNIEKIGFKSDLTLSEPQFAGNLIAINSAEITFSEIEERPGFNEFIAKTFREKIFKSKTPETGSLKVYEIADAGITGINKLLGWDMSLQKTRNEKGDLKSLYFSSRILKFNAPVKKVQLEP